MDLPGENDQKLAKLNGLQFAPHSCMAYAVLWAGHCWHGAARYALHKSSLRYYYRRSVRKPMKAKQPVSNVKFSEFQAATDGNARAVLFPVADSEINQGDPGSLDLSRSRLATPKYGGSFSTK